MALVKVKPTSNGRRAVVKLVNPALHKGAPVAALTEKKNRKSGRNNAGRITMRHQGGGHKKHYRLIDFLRNKDGVPAKVERLAIDPDRGGEPALGLFPAWKRRANPARRCRSETFLWVLPYIASRCLRARARSWRALRGPRCNCL